MNITKKGFTLIEILIAVTIVGIIAAITVPFLTTNIQRMQTGPKLAKIVKQIELGVRNVLEECNSNISNTGSSGDRLSVFTQRDFIGNDSPTNLTNSWEVVAPSLGMEVIDIADEDIFLNNYNGTTSVIQNTIRANSLRFAFSKQGAIVYLFRIITGNSLDSTIAVFHIDINGLNGPNAYGRDLFLFRLTNGGKLIPYGLDIANDHYTVTCTNNNIIDGRSCSARVVKDGFKINY